MDSIQRLRRVRKRRRVEAARFLGIASDGGRRLLLIRHGRANLVYLATPILDRLPGYVGLEVTGFTLEKCDGSGYDVQLAEDGHYKCECLGYLRHDHCKHGDALLVAIRHAPETVGYRHGGDQECPF